MGSDKSELVFHDGLTQKERGINLLESVCDEAFTSTVKTPVKQMRSPTPLVPSDPSVPSHQPNKQTPNPLGLSSM